MWKACVQSLGVAFLLVCVQPLCCASDSCGPGVSTPGVTIPKGDIVIEYGKPLEIFCILNSNHRDAVDRTSSDLVFYHNDKPVPSEFVTIVNVTTKRLYVELPPASKSMYYCKLRSREDPKELVPVCLNSVAVAYEPEEVQNFECISRNWENLTCKWKKPLNYIKTTYQLRLRLPGRAGGRANYFCPNNLDIKQDKCYWDLRSDPHYRQPYEYYYFNITGQNYLGHVSFPIIEFHHYAHVIPNPALNLSLLNVTYESVCISWMIPVEMKSFPPGVDYKVKYQSVWDSRDTWDEYNTAHLNPKDSHHVLNISKLKYANTLYDIKVYGKSAAASAVGKDRWSIPANITVKTKPTVPGSAPRTDVGSFEVSGGLPNRDVYLYWQHIPEYLQNGDHFEYRVFRVEYNGKLKVVNPHDSSKAYVMLKGINFNSYKYIIKSANEEGESVDQSVLYIPSRRESPPEPLSFTKIAYDHGVYELSWKPPKKSNFTIENYTIFWCDNERDRPYQCKGFLNWTHVPRNATFKKIALDDKIYQFAISANTKNASSGMVWASCTVIHDKVVGKMKNVWINSIGATFIEVGWKLDCSDRVGIVTGFRIFFCPIISPYNLACREPEMNTTVFGDPSTIHGKVTGLKPYTTYMVAVAVETKNGIGVQSDPLFNTTLEAAPEQPKEVKITNITNSSMVVSWKPPAQMNGVLLFYEVYYNERKKRVELPNTSVILDNLRSYYNYSISVTACTVECSKPSKPVFGLTEIGSPDVMDHPLVQFLNSSLVLVSWQPPAHSAGVLNYYEVMVVQESDGSNSSQFFYNTSDTSFQIPIPDCFSDGSSLTYQFSVRGVNIGPNNVSYPGPWSQPDASNCFKQPASSLQRIVFWVLGSFVFAIIVVVVVYLAKRLWQQCKFMHDVEVKLPPGLAPINDKHKDQEYNLHVHNWQIGDNRDIHILRTSADEEEKQKDQEYNLNVHNWQIGDDRDIHILRTAADEGEKQKDQEYNLHVHNWQIGDDRDIHILRTSADEEPLLAKKKDQHGHNPSGDSSGCSSGHDSVSSSLTSGTHMSSDSGTEVDQRAGSPDGDGVFSESPGWVCSSLRQRNVSSRTDSGDPYIKMGSLSVVARSTPNLSDLPETLDASNLGTGACLGTWSSSAGYISVPSSEEMSRQVSEAPSAAGYCRVGLDSGIPSSDSDAVLPRLRPKGYVSLASMIDSSSPSSSSLGQGYVAHRPKDSAPKTYISVPPSYCDQPEQLPQAEPDQSYCRMGLKPVASGYVTLSDATQAPDVPRTGGYVPHTRFVNKNDSSCKPDGPYVQVFTPGTTDASKSPTTSV